MPNTKPTPDTLLEASDAARILELSASMVRELSDAGKLPTLRTLRGTRLFRFADVEALAAERKKNPPQAGLVAAAKARLSRTGGR